MANLPNVFSIQEYVGEEDNGYEVILAPELADYSCSLQYDERGNANITVTRKSTEEVVLDMSLDNGEINELEPELFD